jgi:hypothetical protein
MVALVLLLTLQAVLLLAAVAVGAVATALVTVVLAVAVLAVAVTNKTVLQEQQTLVVVLVVGLTETQAVGMVVPALLFLQSL